MVLKLTPKARHVAATSSPSYTLQDGPRVSDPRRKLDHIARRLDVLLHGGRTLVQPRLPALVTQFGLMETRPEGRAAPPVSDTDRAAEDFAEAAAEDPDIIFIEHTPPPDPAQHRRKRAAQWERWQRSVLPMLRPELARLLHETKSLRDLDGRRPQSPSCACNRRSHKVAVVHFSSIEDVEIHICDCTPAAVQLMRLGAFGCAPMLPSLAVDLRVLEFAMNMFLQISPNNTAFSLTLERVLANMGFQLEHQNSLRRRFSNCLMWYTHLRNLLKHYYSSIIDTTREELVGPERAGFTLGSLIPGLPYPAFASTIAWAGSKRAGFTSVSLIPRLPYPAFASPITRAGFERTGFTLVGLIPRLSYPVFASPTTRAGSKRPGFTLGSLIPRLPYPAQAGSRRAGFTSGSLIPRLSYPVFASPTSQTGSNAGFTSGSLILGLPYHFVRHSSCNRHFPFPEPPPRLRPSEYLRRRCPACFGNLKHDASEIADVHVCIDACFTQKKKKSPRDPPKNHPDTHFIPEEQAARTEAYVDGVRNVSHNSARTRKRRAGVQAVEEEEDGYEHERLLLPRSVLDGCEASFKAADEKRQKASTEFFEDTTLMALVCRHDRVLWVVNMHTAGEKQFYVVALMHTLFQHLPHDIRVGLLYDVACAFERSLSVFHAFGHEWACQLLYHPRKRVGFGFTNGEGCERFWQSIRHLIPHLRISGEASLFRLAEWIRRRYRHSVQKRADTTRALRECGKPKLLLGEQWKMQVIAQTKPLPRRTKTRGQQAVNAVMLLRAAVKIRQGQVRELRQRFLEAVQHGHPDATVCQAEYLADQQALEKAEGTLRRKEEALGVDEHEELEQLATSEYMRLRMNARALKLRLRKCLRARKFEMDVVERAYRRLRNDAKLHAHTESAVKRREPTITKLVTEYNKLCAQIAKLIRDANAPPGSMAPIPIPPKGLWQVDVDDTLFQDVGIDNDTDAPSPWLSDEKVRAGIKALLELDRCDEEDSRLRREKLALQVWFREEWEIITEAIKGAACDTDEYHLCLQQDRLVRLCATWDKCLPRCRVDVHLAARGEDRHYGEDNDEGDGEVDPGEESGGEDNDFGMLDAMERADIYRNNEADY
ncbi:hypothetical protein DFH08DRAFT_965053 [Mycena albidolilacea]|uniref:CxC2-like cysteine cluster KDZ transposase-associated domain-containing protein n=1 Tax=Mycena albidolilacea TaxID=1033008 RepID=A0AAD6ZRI9_9AGAR|nr:hypothetical protein DFH08DRAFT_965053 [Mycena albidolilacea]